MRTTKWLLEPEVFNGELDRFSSAISRRGLPHAAITFGRSYEEYLNVFPEEDRVIFVGSWQFAKLLTKHRPHWLIANEHRLDCTYYYPRLRKFLLNQHYCILPFGEMEHRRDWIMNAVGIGGQVFVRPCSAKKLFTGAVIKEADWDKTVALASARIQPEALVLLARPRKIKAEWRAIVVNGKVVAGSQYKPDREPGLPPAVQQYAEKVAGSGFNPDPAWTLDICKTESDTYHLLEVGAFSCSGFYLADPDAIIDAVTSTASS